MSGSDDISGAYGGDVSPGGDVQTRVAGCLRITKVAVDAQMSNNCYLMRCEESGDQVLLDAAAEPERLLALIGEQGLSAVITTHQHWDHHRALAAVVGATGADVLVGEPDAAAVTEQTGVTVTRALEHGDTVAVGRCTLEVVALAGHTPGSVALLFDDAERGDGRPHLFTGDSLFPGGPGKTAGPAEFTSLMDDLEERVFSRLADNTWFYPGHGDDSTLGEQRPQLDEWRERGW